MQIITPEMKSSMSFASKVSREKSDVRKFIEGLLVGQSALFLYGIDYQKDARVYSAATSAKYALNAKYETKKLADGTGLVVTRIA